MNLSELISNLIPGLGIALILGIILWKAKSRNPQFRLFYDLTISKLEDHL